MARLRTFLVVLVVVVPVVLARGAHKPLWASARSAGDGISTAFAVAGALVRPAPPSVPFVVAPEAEDAANAADVADVADLRDVPLAAPSETSSRPRAARRNRALFVDAGTVLKLARARVVPSGRSVAATRSRPAGIEVHGVAPLGIGVRDGDVLTDVDGRSVRTEGEVIAAVLAARAHEQPRISSRFFRNGLPWSLVVEMPYPAGSAR